MKLKEKAKLLLKIYQELIKDMFKFIFGIILFIYVFSGFGILFIFNCIGGMFGNNHPAVTIINSIVVTLIISSWIVFIIKWFKYRIKNEINKL